MKAFKGCVNKECKAYKKIHYKNEDKFCKYCGEPLQYVCADCWKQLDTNKERYCESCQLEREQKKQEMLDKAGNVGAKAGAAAMAAVAFAKQVGIDAGTVKKVGIKVVNVIKK